MLTPLREKGTDAFSADPDDLVRRQAVNVGQTLPSVNPTIYRSAFSIASATSGDSGVTLGSKRATTLPSLSTRNLVKFHWISLPVAAVRN